MRAVPKTQITAGQHNIWETGVKNVQLPTVIIKRRVLAQRVATRPAIKSEMTWSERPAQSRRAVWSVFQPRPLMMEPEKSTRQLIALDTWQKGTYW